MKTQSIQKIREENQEIYFLHEETILLLNKIQEGKYKVLEEYKNDNRTYVAKILLNESFFILKKIFYPRKMKRILSVFKRGDVVDSFFNIESARIHSLEELARILAVKIKRENKKIREEICLMEYCSGNHLETEKEFLKAMEVLKKIHEIHKFHGDCNPNNFLVNGDLEIKVVDTKLKKMKFGNYRAHYDILTLLQYFKNGGKYPYGKNIFYYFAYIIRRIRDFKDYCKKKKR